MPKYETPEPISVTLELGVGDVRITASDRTDTVVEVRPSDPGDESDVRTADQVRVDHTDGVLRIIGPKSRVFDFSRRTRSVDVTVELPTGSHVSARLQVGDVRGAGLLGECRVTTSAGNVRLERSGPVHLDTSAGHVTADAVTGSAEVSTGSGKVRIGTVTGTAEVKNSDGDITIDAVTGDVRVRTANGDLSVGKAGAGIDAKTSHGDIRLGEVVRGSVVLGTGKGDLEIGIAEGTAAWLELDTGFGRVSNLLENAARPEESDETVEVRGHSSFGDITIRRS